jgi:hypothetical protein
MIDSFQIVNTNATGAVTAGQVQASLPTQQLSNGKAAVQGEIEASCLVDITTCFTQSAPPTTLPLQTNTTSTTTNATANEATNATTITSPSTENTTNATSQSGANATNATNSSLLTYENSTYGIKIQFPSDWLYKESNASNNSVQTIVSFDPSYLVPRFHRTL